MDLSKYIEAAHLQSAKKHREQARSLGVPINKMNQPPGHVIRENSWFNPDTSIVVSIHTPFYLPLGKALPPHKHDFYEISYVYSGEFHNIIEGNTYVQKSNTLTLLGPAALHTAYIRDEDDVVFNIMLRRDLVENIFIKILSGENVFYQFFLDSVYLSGKSKPYLIFDCSTILSELVHKIIAEYFDKNSFFEDAIIAKLFELFIEIARLNNDMLIDNIKVDNDELPSAIMKYIRTNYSRVTLEKAAAVFNYSPSYISRTISTTYGKNFSEILHDIKLENTCSYLKKSNLSIQNIVSLVGYNDISHFNKIFRRKYNMSPSQYRKTAHDKADS